MLIDSHGRQIDYLRISVTDRCNLRCQYCLPEESSHFLPRQEILTYEEMLRIITICADLGIRKLRFTGGEPFVRRDFIQLLEAVRAETTIAHIHITTNGTLIEPHLRRLTDLEIRDLNFSLDSIRPDVFEIITRRDSLDTVLKAIRQAVQLGHRVKINTVIQRENADEIVDIVKFFKSEPIDIRFIEFMPFHEQATHDIFLNHLEIESVLRQAFPTMREKSTPPHSTARVYAIDEISGTIGIIAGFSRTFCGSCNRLRLSPTGDLQSCLYGDPELNLKAALRGGISDTGIAAIIQDVVSKKHRDGRVAEAARSATVFQSMSKIGG